MGALRLPQRPNHNPREHFDLLTASIVSQPRPSVDNGLAQTAVPEPFVQTNGIDVAHRHLQVHLRESPAPRLLLDRPN